MVTFNKRVLRKWIPNMCLHPGKWKHIVQEWEYCTGIKDKVYSDRYIPTYGLKKVRCSYLEVCNFIKRRLRQRSFPVNFVRFLKATILCSTSAKDCLCKPRESACSHTQFIYRNIINIKSYHNKSLWEG